MRLTHSWLLAAGVMLAVSAFGCARGASPPQPTPPTPGARQPAPEAPAVTATTAAAVQAGRELVQQQNCRLCHIIGGEGGRVGPNLDIVAPKRAKEWLIEQMGDPAARNPDTQMLPVKLPEEELAQIAEYLLSLGQKGKQ